MQSFLASRRKDFNFRKEEKKKRIQLRVLSFVDTSHYLLHCLHFKPNGLMLWLVPNLFAVISILIKIKKVYFFTVFLLMKPNNKKLDTIINYIKNSEKFAGSLLNNSFVIMKKVYLYTMPKLSRPIIFYSPFANILIFCLLFKILFSGLCSMLFVTFYFFYT